MKKTENKTTPIIPKSKSTAKYALCGFITGNILPSRFAGAQLVELNPCPNRGLSHTQGQRGIQIPPSLPEVMALASRSSTPAETRLNNSSGMI